MIVIKRKSRLPNFVRASDGHELVRAINQAHDKAGLFIKRDLVRGLTTGKRNGQIYDLGGGRYHQASAAGEFPARLTGALAASVGIRSKNKQFIVGVGAKYAGYLEEGTTTMAARPHLRPAVERNLRNVEKFVTQEIAKVLK